MSSGTDQLMIGMRGVPREILLVGPTGALANARGEVHIVRKALMPAFDDDA